MFSLQLKDQFLTSRREFNGIKEIGANRNMEQNASTTIAVTSGDEIEGHVVGGKRGGMADRGWKRFIYDTR